MSQFVYPQEVSPFIGTFSSYPWTFQDKGMNYQGLDFQCLNELHGKMIAAIDAENSCTTSSTKKCHFTQLHRQTQNPCAISPDSTNTVLSQGSSPSCSTNMSLLTSRSSSSCSINKECNRHDESPSSNDTGCRNCTEDGKPEFSENVLKFPPILPSQTSSNRGLIFVSKICPLCGKSFTRRSTLQIHLLIHTNLKPFKCSFCDKDFNVKSNLNRHERIHRQKVISPSSSAASSAKKPLPCPESSHPYNNAHDYPTSHSRYCPHTTAGKPTKASTYRKSHRLGKCPNVNSNPSASANVLYH